MDADEVLYEGQDKILDIIKNENFDPLMNNYKRDLDAISRLVYPTTKAIFIIELSYKTMINKFNGEPLTKEVYNEMCNFWYQLIEISFDHLDVDTDVMDYVTNNISTYRTSFDESIKLYLSQKNND